MTTIVLKTDVLRRALSNAVLFAGTDDTLPALCAVRFDVTGKEGSLMMVATDRYVLSYEDTPVVKVAGVDHTFGLGIKDSFSLGIKDAKEVIRLLPKRPALPAAETTVEYDPETGSIRFAVDDGPEVTFRAVTSDYPRYQPLIDRFAPAERDFVALNPAYLAKLAKVDSGVKPSRYAPPAVRLELAEGTRPVRFSVGETFKAILMPVRIPAE